MVVPVKWPTQPSGSVKKRMATKCGSGLFTLHVDGKVYEIECVQDDLIAVPDGALHWFDMGPEPRFIAIRFFTEPDGWVGHFTGTTIAQEFPRYEGLTQGH